MVGVPCASFLFIFARRYVFEFFERYPEGVFRLEPAFITYAFDRLAKAEHLYCFIYTVFSYVLVRSYSYRSLEYAYQMT